MTGSNGHPQDPNSPAQLEWNNKRSDHYVSSRLMCDGFLKTTPNDPGIRLIKKEWDLIETWLRNEEAHQRLP